MRDRGQSGQVLVIVAVWMVALIGSAALVLLAGSVEWQQNQLQQLADQAALDAALKIGVGCTAGSATTVITEADNFLATQRTRTGSLSISGAGCTAPYAGTDTFATGLTETVHYPYRSLQQQVEVILTLSLPISFGSYMGATNTTVTRRAVAQQLSGWTNAVSATTLSCTGGQLNVAGSIATSNTITLSGGCAVYAHARFDATSGTYSDPGDVSVYAGGQTWVGGGGLCSAGGMAGSTNAVCADGSELSGHVSMTCGVSGTSAYLSAGVAGVDPNPCAAGKGPLPVPPLASSRPPEPNTDASALATLPGGTACSPTAVYANLVVGTTTVGTAEAGTPVPTKDSANYYHFKPSCYGYLNPGSLAGGSSTIARVQTGPETAVSLTTVTPTLSTASKAGNLLVVTLRSTNSSQSTAPAGWVLANGVFQSSAYRAEIWYYPNNPGGLTSAAFNVGSSVYGVAQMTEWSGVATSSPLDQTGTKAISTATKSANVSTSGGTAVANELVITDNGWSPGVGTYTPGAGWTNLLNDSGDGYASDYRLNLAAGATSESVTNTKNVDWSMVIATFKPAPLTAGSVLDPGFYYFNGSGFAGGGGLCLNGTTLLARDVTLEFVNQAGFSSGTCAAGGGGGCSTGACRFGSTPCSISACPPNTVADSAGGGFTWFAAPCSQAPAGDASCAGSAWCPAGDRACWNLLIWAPATNTGQIAMAGSAYAGWLLGSVFWPGTCTYAANGTSALDGTLSCGTLSVSASSGGIDVGSDYGINTAVVEAELVE